MRGRPLLRVAALLLAGLGAAAARAQSGPPADTLAAVRARGRLVCGVAVNGPGLSEPDSQGVWRGLDADYCRAFAAAIFGDPDRLRFVPTTTAARFTALQSGEVDLLARATTWTMTRDASQGLAFVGVNLFDGQGFLVRKSLGVKSAKELNGATVCLLPGTTSEQNVSEYFHANGMTFSPVVIEQAAELDQAFLNGRCDVYSNDRSDIVGLRSAQGAKASDLVILPETISKEPLGPLVRQGDWRWFSLVKWVHYALVDAEELGVTQANLDRMRSSPDAEVRRLLGAEGGLGKELGLADSWAADAIRAVGNYGEIWQRNQAPLGVERGYNRLWKDGGLQYAPPLR